jgi:hypothetical protein
MSTTMLTTISREQINETKNKKSFICYEARTCTQTPDTTHIETRRHTL